MNDDWIIFADAFVDPMIIRVIYLSILRRKKKKERKKKHIKLSALRWFIDVGLATLGDQWGAAHTST